MCGIAGLGAGIVGPKAEKAQAVVQEVSERLDALEAEAGISAMTAKADRESSKRNWRYIMRKAYWSVHDGELRSRIIDLIIESQQAIVRYWRAVVEDSQDSLHELERNSPRWDIYAFVAIGILGWLGSEASGPTGAAIGAAVGLVIGLTVRDSIRLNHSFDIRTAQAKLAAERSKLAEIESETPLFSFKEQISYEPDGEAS